MGETKVVGAVAVIVSFVALYAEFFHAVNQITLILDLNSILKILEMLHVLFKLKCVVPRPQSFDIMAQLLE